MITDVSGACNSGFCAPPSPSDEQVAEQMLDRVVMLARRRAEMREEVERLDREIEFVRREIARMEGVR